MCSETEIVKKLNNIEYKCDYDLKKLCSFGIGGIAKMVVFPKSKQELIQACSVLQNPIVIGNGTNILFSDDVLFSPIVVTRKMTEEIVFSETTVRVSAGTSLSKLCSICAKHGLSGLENLFGIPATIGGAIIMNAGAFGSEICDTLESVLIFESGRVKEVKSQKIKFGYRYSSLQNEKIVIIEATFNLKRSDKGLIESKIKDNILWRAEHQPVGKSAGSVFKKSEKPAGFLIEQVGLKGFKIGGAVISNKHANFIINEQNASASDVLKLITLAKHKVYTQFGILLEEEIKYIGEYNGCDRGFPYS